MFKAIFKFSEGLILGAIGGYVAGLLLAPKTGRQLRAEISEQSEQLYEQAAQRFDDLADATAYKMQDVRSKAAHTARDLQLKASDAVHDVQSKTSHAMQDLQVRGEQLIQKAAISVSDTRKRIVDKLDAAMNQAANSLVDDNEISGG
jgi:gas vesicle protein